LQNLDLPPPHAAGFEGRAGLGENRFMLASDDRIEGTPRGDWPLQPYAANAMPCRRKSAPRPMRHDRLNALVNVWSTHEHGFAHIWLRLNPPKFDLVRRKVFCLQGLVC
jgi:hypothetical protein